MSSHTITLRNIFRLEVHLNRKIIINALIQKHWLKVTKSGYSLSPCWSGWWSQSDEVMVAVLKAVVL